MTEKIKSHAKINLFLNILEKLPSKLHNIQTASVLVDLCDEISIKRVNATKDKIIFKGKFRNYIDKKNNSIMKTIRILREKKIIKDFYKIIIKKNIPVFAGLGGGSSNAAYLIKYFYKKNLDKINLKIFKKAIGTDLLLFSKNQLFQKNLHQAITFRDKLDLYFVLVFPNIKCSTKKIYQIFDKNNNISKKRYNNRIKKKDIIRSFYEEGNNLERVVEDKYPNITKILNFLGLQKGCYFSRITGSGSVCFGIFKAHKDADSALKQTKLKFPKYWCAITKTI